MNAGDQKLNFLSYFCLRNMVRLAIFTRSAYDLRSISDTSALIRQKGRYIVSFSFSRICANLSFLNPFSSGCHSESQFLQMSTRESRRPSISHPQSGHRVGRNPICQSGRPPEKFDSLKSSGNDEDTGSFNTASYNLLFT